MERSSTKRPGDIAPWVYKAEEDFRTATTMARKRRDPVPDNVCFCAHQCAEKYLKAFLVFHRVRFPRTHSLQALLDLASDQLLIGIVNRNVLPFPSSLSTQILPPCISTNRLAIARPSPVPSTSRVTDPST